MKHLVLLFAITLAVSANAQLTNQERMLGQGGVYEIYSTSQISKSFYAYEISACAEIDVLKMINRSLITDTVDLHAIFGERDSALQGGIYFIPKKYKGAIIKMGSGTCKLFLD
jgi:hypothetical protein